MIPIEKLVAVFVIAAILAVAAGALWTGVAWAARATKLRKSRRLNRFERAVLVLGAALLLSLLYAWLIEPYWVEVTRVRITSSKAPSGARPIRIVHISDMHSEAKPRNERKLPAIVAAEKPDLIVFTGDALTSLAGQEVFRRCMAQLAAIAPTFAVKGNWERWFTRGADCYAGTGVRELNGEGVEFKAGETSIYVAGVDFGEENRTGQALAGAPPGVFTLFLYHLPDEIEALAARGVDLVCCGHTHGGQVCAPFYGALITLSKYGKRFESGLYRVDRTWLYVNRGMGVEGLAPPLRFLARPEVTVIEVAPATGRDATP